MIKAQECIIVIDGFIICIFSDFTIDIKNITFQYIVSDIFLTAN